MCRDTGEPVRLVVILGPTAVGKTQTAIQLAEHFGGEIVSADSRLFYRGMDIGTAKPSLPERRRVPHHLMDVADISETWSLALFQRRAQQAIAAIGERGRLPFLVGGTGQYIRAVLQGWKVPEMPPDRRMRQVLQDWSEEIGAQALHQRLAVLDRQAADRIDPRNLRRTVRALEVILLSGKRFSGQRTKEPSPYNSLVLGLERPREELYQRIDARIEAMFAAGLVDEVQGLLAGGASPDLPAFSAIGYRQVIAHLEGKITLEEAVADTKRTTRTFVRRQANWFKKDNPHIHWFRFSAGILAEMQVVIQAWLHDSNL